MPKLHAIMNRDADGIRNITVFGSPIGQKPTKDGGFIGAPSELVLERYAHGIKIRLVQATHADGSPCAPDYWKANEMVIDHPEGLRALRDAISKLLDQCEDIRYQDA